jgi:hypothetical protein
VIFRAKARQGQRRMRAAAPTARKAPRSANPAAPPPGGIFGRLGNHPARISTQAPPPAASSSGSQPRRAAQPCVPPRYAVPTRCACPRADARASAAGAWSAMSG